MTDPFVAALGLLVGVALGGWWTRRRAGRAVQAIPARVSASDTGAGTGWTSTDLIADQLATERRQLVDLVDEYQRENDMMDRVLRSVADPVFLVGDRSRILYANQAAWSLFGDSLDREGNLLHHRLLEVIRTASDDRDTQILEGLDGQQTYEAATNRAADGSVLVMLRNVTDERRVSEMRRDFVADASHELKTPVASIQAASETVLNALDDGDTDSAQRFAAQAAASAVRLSRIVSDLLDLSRLEATEAATEVVDLGLLLSDVVGRSQGHPSPSIVAPDAPVIVSGSRSDLSLAVSNLVGNAIRHTPDAGSVSVRLRSLPGFAELQVSDTGEGIPSKHLDRVFERFYRVDSARSRGTGGTGLGLSIVRHVVAQHGGTIGVDSVLGEGTTFTVRLPLMSDDRTPTNTLRNEHCQGPLDDRA